ncbi:MAG TPA: hypothetical protein VMV32_06290, partial [Ignavibacteriaceae bacterium]|nr:hypothetical protein [Ignavibacteriaceae bacterium]
MKPFFRIFYFIFIASTIFYGCSSSKLQRETPKVRPPITIPAKPKPEKLEIIKNELPFTLPHNA